MTLLIAWQNADGLCVAADTRIHDGEFSLTDTGPKIFSIPVAVSEFGVHPPPACRHPNIGIAFAGNTLLAQSAIAIAGTTLQNLMGLSAEKAPTINDVAELMRRCVQHAVDEQRFLRPTPDVSAEFFVFGHSITLNAPQLFVIYLDENDNGSAESKLTEVELKNGRLIYLGSGDKALLERLDRLDEEEAPRTTPLDLLGEIIKDSDVRSVGGAVQFATAAREGVSLRPVMMVAANGEAQFFVLGCDLKKLGTVGDLLPYGNALVLELSEPVDI